MEDNGQNEVVIDSRRVVSSRPSACLKYRRCPFSMQNSSFFAGLRELEKRPTKRPACYSLRAETWDQSIYNVLFDAFLNVWISFNESVVRR